MDRIVPYGVFYNMTTGIAISQGTRFPEFNPFNVGFYEHPDPIDFEREEWNKETRRIGPKDPNKRRDTLEAQRQVIDDEIAALPPRA